VVPNGGRLYCLLFTAILVSLGTSGCAIVYQVGKEMPWLSNVLHMQLRLADNGQSSGFGIGWRANIPSSYNLICYIGL
jgi:hypothetical protein